MLYIKGFDSNLQCRDFQFEVGKEYKIEDKGEPEICTDTVFHFCGSLAMAHEYYECSSITSDANRFCYIECLSEVLQEGDKYGCAHIKIVREITGDELNLLLGLSNGNIGLFNTGMRNIGTCNIGNENTGNYNIGNRCTGSRNIGSMNSGNSNTGAYNTGSKNTGQLNNGNANTGHGNDGDINTGDENCGAYNTGVHNCGNRNTGIFNACHDSTGIFCNKTETIKIFNQDSGMTMEEFKNTEWHTILVYRKFHLVERKSNASINNIAPYKEACAVWWRGLYEKEKLLIQTMPNFDKDVFEDITGIKL